MSSTRWLAAGLGVSYTVGAGIFLVVEPTMGFRTFDDFWNPALVVPALTSYAWLVSDLCHLASGVLLVLLAASLGDATQKGSRLISVLALCAGTTFVLLAMLDRAAALLPAQRLHVPDSDLEVGQQPLFAVGTHVVGQRSHRHTDLDVLPVASVLVRSASRHPGLGSVDAALAMLVQRHEVAVGDENHVSATSAVTSVGPAERNEFLATESDAPVSAVASVDGDLDLVDE